jgi:protein-L-isoaspartate(D-aspartate) O-methyltransferase
MSSPVMAPPEKMLFQLGLRRRGISDQALLRALEAVPRDRFVDPPYRNSAWRDTALPIACGQTISQPFVVAYMIEQLNLRESHRVLEIGTGSGYQTAILSRLSKWVLSVERFKTLADSARDRLEAMRFDNVEVMFGDGFALPDGVGSFDRILVTSSIAEEPQALLERLEPDGLLIAPIGPPQGRQTLVRFQRTEDAITRKPLVDVRFVPALRGTAREL